MSSQPVSCKESVINITEDERQVPLEHIHDEGNRETYPRSSPKISRTVSASKTDEATTHDDSTSSTPDGQLFSTNYVDHLVESFWTKIDQKIDDAVSHQQTTQTNQEQTRQREIQEEKNKKAKAIEKYSEYFNCSYSFIYIVEFLLRIWTICKTRVFGKAKTVVTFLFSIPWQENIAFYLFHRHAHFVVFLLTLIDVTLVLLLILRDFDIIDGKGKEALFKTFQMICISILICFVLEVLLKIISVGKDIFKYSLEKWKTGVIKVLQRRLGSFEGTLAIRLLEDTKKQETKKQKSCKF